MDNITLIHICSFFGMVFSTFWLANAIFIKKNKEVSYFWGFSNVFIGIAFYFHTFINKQNYLLGYYIADLFFLLSLFFIHIGLLKFFKQKFIYQFYIFIIFWISQSLFRFFEHNFLAIFNVSFYMLYVCASLNYIILKNLDIKEDKLKWFIISPVALSFLLMSFRLIALVVNPLLYSDNLTLNNTFNTYIGLGALVTIVFLNGTLLGVVLSSLIIKVNYLANVDTLTKLFNRRYLYQVISKYEEKEKPYSILLLDIDFFKKINDSFGHDVGDKVLVEFSYVINNVLKDFKNTTFFRLGGEEFAIVFQSTTKHVINELAEQIHTALLNHDWTSGVDYNPTISIGISIQDNKNTLKEMLKQSDLALYKAKANGRNQSVFSYTL